MLFGDSVELATMTGAAFDGPAAVREWATLGERGCITG
jgi:hypothetical protein